ncbi:glycosyltransferase family 2 protein [Dokdonia sp. Hel_I_53]|uniref:glycosyltransferase family 2 protein n=1 Tax=Dokdonia sp. Hel_I_53 TaxID=1566287 RepID=UPI00119B77B8|nr:glycosyltransferase family 2 protein [Dokdonia sp. Hel_I_53]TVZ53390.1 glycosyltransferase involved in cell wall biosynthesis [Dokdonia sp. Hel_I_53]
MNSFSIITINYNNAKGLQRTLQSVAKQKQHLALQYIVIDGASTDESANILKEFEEHIDIYISKKDNGVYDAMNKGIARATGDYILFLNSGDHFAQEIQLQQLLMPIEDQDIIAYDIELVGNKKKIKRHPEVMTFSYLYNTSPAHQALLFKRSLFDKLGGYRTDLKMVSDWKFVLDAVVLLKATYVYIPEVLTTYYMDGMSSTPQGLKEGALAKKGILEAEYPAFIDDYERLRHFKKRRFQLLEKIEKAGGLRKKITTAILSLLSTGTRTK